MCFNQQHQLTKWLWATMAVVEYAVPAAQSKSAIEAC